MERAGVLILAILSIQGQDRTFFLRLLCVNILGFIWTECLTMQEF
jgi:hypothetical protein